MSYSWEDYAADSPQRYDWQEYAGPVGTTMADWDRAEERRPLGENERAQKNAKDWLSNYAAGIMTGGNKYQNLASSSSARRRERSSPYGSQQVFDNFSIYTPPPIGGYSGGGAASSGSGGAFGKIGGLAGTIGLAAGIFGPLGPAIGAGVGGLIDQFA